MASATIGVVHAPEVGTEERSRASSEDARRPSLVSRVFVANGAVLALGFLLLVFGPIEVSAPVAAREEVIILVVGLVLMLALDLFLLRHVLGPIRQLTDGIERIDPNRPGRRLPGLTVRSREVGALAGAFNEMLDRLESERRESARVALAAQERERMRVARELHDEIGQRLTAVAINAERAAEDGESASSEALHAVVDDVRDSLEDVRRIARELRPEALDDLGLVNALIALCSRVTDVRVERRFDRDLPPLDHETELVIYRIAQESLTNVSRHAKASRAVVALRREGDSIVLTVRDDGRGLPAELPRGTAGISGMRERALLVGGALTISSEPGKGTEVRLSVPTGGSP
jgi:two-component system sensor histidine kinase UhpB